MWSFAKCRLKYFLLFAIFLRAHFLCRDIFSQNKPKVFFINNIANNRKQKLRENKKIISVNSIKGIRTFNQTQYKKREYLFNIWKDIARKFSYTFYDLPVLENFGLFQKNNINEYYDFIKNKRHLILRPEITPQLINYLFFKNGGLTNKLETDMPTCRTNCNCADSQRCSNKCRHKNTSQKQYMLQNFKKTFKMCTIGQCFRYEKISNYRKREHYQWNMDIIGINNINAEIELFTILLTFFKQVKLYDKDIIIKINNKQIIKSIILKVFKNSLLHYYSQKQIDEIVVNKILHILDKYNKISKSNFKLLLQKNIPFIKYNDINNFNNIIYNIKTVEDLEIFFNFNPNICNDNSVKNILNYFKNLNLHTYFKMDLATVRGLDYYKNTIFEVFYKNKINRAICGGGRYDFILNKTNIPAVGFGMGDVVISEILFNKENTCNTFDESINIVSFFPNINNNNIKLKNDKYKEYYDILHTLRMNNIKIYTLLQNNLTLSKALKKANSLKSDYFLFCQENEENHFILKNLKTGHQQIVNLENILSIYSSI
ncbi:histidine--tRNA ligase, putative [Plasmodium chabaudi chabaudi]|uniref:histidine--tRNA ligase n=1 Tax=Plasmodium chabaudi chabaudi TaxID=31271 RepID=A0A4V0K6A3_PLACU|nr:histidine--tRNA ligase, putative [Plasmodium chabaudi chabaudi]VTZ68561.1 histidine--tRNA ligase, putative [Plasmodium chabaudi chabaudi]|eukprot:XP_745285.1 histidine--tRNA ligase, putative [Plasmodium chabaudi chabaudi]